MPEIASTAEDTLRSFQQHILSRARHNNVVMVGDTGIGKTYVAIVLLSQQDYSRNKRAFFMAPTRQLVLQIESKIRQITTLPVRAYCSSEFDYWDEYQWEQELGFHRVFVTTPQVVRNALEKGYISMKNINLLVFDECHHVSKRHPYAHIMKLYDPNAHPDDKPRIFGATACPTQNCAEHLCAEIHKVDLKEAETILYAAVAPILYEKYPRKTNKGKSDPALIAEDMETSSEDRTISSNLMADCHVVIKAIKEAKVAEVYRKLLNDGKKKIPMTEVTLTAETEKFIRTCIRLYRSVGLWCFYRFVELELERLTVVSSSAFGLPGTVLGWDQDAVTTILMISAERTKCDFACTPRVEKAVEIVKHRLMDGRKFITSDEVEASDQTTVIEDSDCQLLEEVKCGIPKNILMQDADVIVDDEPAETLDKSPSSDQSAFKYSMQGIIFVQTRVECRVLTEYLNDRFKEKELERDSPDEDESANEDDDFMNCDFIGDDEANKFSCILGQMSKADSAAFALSDMKTILDRFQQGKTRMLVSTSVSVEGVDFPLCGLIVVMDPVTSPRMLIQLRGRARHNDGAIYYLGEEGDVMDEVNYKSLLVKAEQINAMNFESDKQETLHNQPRSKSVRDLQTCQFVADDCQVAIKSTGAIIDLDSSTSSLHQFCQSLPPLLFDVNPQKLFTIESLTTAHNKQMYKAKVSLPNQLGVSACESGLMPSKSLAKAVAALRACRSLYEQGLLDDKLNSIYRKRKHEEGNINVDFFLKRL
uniref:Dicerlike putative n=1 Tax=Albugo laibachii Nc14 TaxID=890382 RepID=F0WER9_9STRA|nr:dicerlike putative [Albugo laibachii Nc14]|eukprot:CCA19701.1 dicerlike putative [Albugo laibachii Nc14]